MHNYGTIEVHDNKEMYFENSKLDKETVVDRNEVDHYKNIKINIEAHLNFIKSTIKGLIFLNDDHGLQYLRDKFLGMKGKVFQTLTHL